MSDRDERYCRDEGQGLTIRQEIGTGTNSKEEIMDRD